MTLPLWLALIAVALIPFIPRLLRLRIRFFRWAHWDWAANVHEQYFDGLVLGVRVGLFLVAAALLYFGM